MNEPRSLVFHISGAKACFRRPEFVDDFVSYDVVPPLTLMRMANSAFPLINGRWHLQRLTVLNSIRFRWDKLVTARGERRALLLHDVAYVAEMAGDETHFEAGPAQVSAGEQRARCHLGLPEFGAELAVIVGEDIPRSALHGTGARDLGWLPQLNSRGKIHYLRTVMADGVIDMTKQDRSFSGT